MVDPDAATRTSLMVQILARVTAGETLRDVCAPATMPSAATVWSWRRSNAAFSAELDLALARGRWRRVWMFDPARAAVLLARYRDGEGVNAILSDPAMPDRDVFNYWKGVEAPFCAEIERLKAAGKAQHCRDLAARRTTVFDSVVADRIVARVMRGSCLNQVLAADPALPSYTVLVRWRREQPEFDRLLKGALARVNGRRLQRQRRRAALEDEIAAAIAAGETLESLGARPDMPHANTLHRWKRADPAFAARIEAAREARRAPRARAERRWKIMQLARRRMADVTRKGRKHPEG